MRNLARRNMYCDRCNYINNNTNNESVSGEEEYANNNGNFNPNNPYNPNFEGYYAPNNGYGGYYDFSRQIFEYNRGNNVDLVNLNIGDRVTVAQLTVDTGWVVGNTHNNMANNNAVVKISVSLNLNYTMTLNEEMDLLFKLYRQDSKGVRTELTSVPYRVSFYGEQETEEVTNNLETKLSKDETFYTEYFDELQRGGEYNYILEVSPTYSVIDSASIQGGYISAVGQIYGACSR